MGPERFTYNRASLQAAFVKEMEREGWLGLIAIRYNDVRDGTTSSAMVLEQYRAAWEGKGMLQENSLYIDSFSPKQDRKRHARDVGFTAW
ncbi:unnamed protein product [Clonostachys rhizophaga]|uniref:Linalool dehydratase/isomerase domain-containing protein n=1 Tax=Clonostachys rhizophaga TaxID=160324 RepID=A0A9N9VK49_9HYPO|nr:unnamed protein product [Clonostachys rhizophaga]